MTRTARMGQKVTALPSTPWARLKAGYRTLQDQSDCDPPITSTVDEDDGVFSDSTLRVTKREKLKKKKRKTENLVTKVRNRVTKKKLRTQFDELELAPLLTDFDEITDTQENTQTVKSHRKSKRSGKDSHTDVEMNPCSASPLDEQAAVSSPLASKRTDKQRKSKKRKTTKSKTRSSSDDKSPLIHSDDESGNETDSCAGDSMLENISTTQGIKVVRKPKSKKTKQVDVKTKVWTGKQEVVEDEKRQKRNEARRLRRQRRKVCFNCREPGHHVSECMNSSQTTGTGICFKCGATNHTSKKCKSSIPEGEYPYAKCFVCGEVGHLSRACPDNPKGLYPHGGGCNLCGSVEHFKANCPDKHQRQNHHEGTLGQLTVGSHSVDAEDFDTEPLLFKPRKAKSRQTESKRSQPKVVTF